MGNYTQDNGLQETTLGMGLPTPEFSSHEEGNQPQEAVYPTWYLARQVISIKGTYTHGGDSRAALEALGFTVIDSHDDLLYMVVPPDGWTRAHDGNFVIIRDETGDKRISMFFKGDVCDRDAHLTIS